MFLSKWPQTSRMFDGSNLSAVWQRWFTALWTSVNTLEVGVQTGAGSPEAVVTAPQGSLYRRTDGGVGTTLYAKNSGGTDPATLTNTGWSAFT